MGFNNIFKFVNFLFFLCFFFQNFENLNGSCILTFSPPKINKNLQQQKIDDFANNDSRQGGVAKTVFSIPMLHADHICFWSPCSIGTRIVVFATPPWRECDFFIFCHTSPAGSSKNMTKQFSDNEFGAPSLTTRIANRLLNRILPRHFFFDVFFLEQKSGHPCKKSLKFPMDFQHYVKLKH